MPPRNQRRTAQEELNEILNDEIDTKVSEIAGNGLCRTLVWIVGLVLGLVTSALILMSRYWVSVLILIPSIVTMIFTLKIKSSLTMLVFLMLELIAFVTSTILLAIVTIANLNCLLSGTICPTGDDSDIKRTVEMFLYGFFFFYTLSNVVLYADLYVSNLQSERRVVTLRTRASHEV